MVTSIDLQGVKILDVVELDIGEVRREAGEGTLNLELLGMTYSLEVCPVDLGVSSTSSPDSVAVDLAATEYFMGAHDDSSNSVRVTITPHWIHMCLAIDGRDLLIDPADGSGESGYYAVHSGERSDDYSVDMSNDVPPPPSAPVPPAASTEGTSDSGSFEQSSALCEPTGTAEETPSTQPSVSMDSNSQNNTCGQGGDPEYRLARIIIASDVEYRNRYPSDWASRMTATLNDICGRYETQVSVTYQLSINPWAIPSGQCTLTEAYALLSQFRTYMVTDAGVSGVARDVSHLFTGKDLDGSTGGVGWEVGVGSVKWGLIDLAYSLSEQWHDSFQNMWSLGHELGHNFNGDHAYWGWIDGCRSFMCPTYSTPATGQFTTNNANRIRSWGQQALDLQKSINPGPSSISPLNLQSSNIAQQGQFIYFVGTQMTVTYDIKNLRTQGITLDLLFVGARDASDTNRDFGHLSNVYIGAGATYKFTSSYTPQSGGVWTLWPAYRENGVYSPYQWLTIVPTVYYDKAHWVGLDNTQSTDNVDLFYRFYVLTTVSTPVSGSTVTVFVSMFNGQSGTGTTTFTYFFVGCRSGSGASADFGYSGQQTVTQRAGSAVTGGGYLVFSSRVLDSTGTWQFWPAYRISGYGPYQWHMLTLAVS